jgi:FkbM family methyltransferase
MKPAIVRRAWDHFAAKFPRVACEVNYHRRNKYFEKDLWLVPTFCSKDATAIDVGVNEGIYSRWMSKFARNVEGFECNPFLRNRLGKFLPHNVRLHQCALSSVNGTAVLRFDPQNTGIGTIETLNKLDNNEGIRSIRQIVVDVRRLDDFTIEKTSFIKIDVEGHEMEVLAGAAQLLSRDRPALLVEIEERHCPGNLVRLPAWMKALGYKTYGLDPRAQALTPLEDIRCAAANGQNNFWFLHI